MGFWDRVNDALGFQDPFERNACLMVESVRKRIRREYGDDLKVTRPLEAEELKSQIMAKNEQGGRYVHKQALAYWQIFKAVYPEWITEDDKPEFISQCWRDDL